MKQTTFLTWFSTQERVLD